MSFTSNDYYVVDFHYIDDQRCLSPLSDSFLHEHSPEELENKNRILSELFEKSGWEGDGQINCIIIAPFLIGEEDGHCDVVYHVKQSNNGTSWLAIPHELQLSLPKGFLCKGKAKI